MKKLSTKIALMAFFILAISSTSCKSKVGERMEILKDVTDIADSIKSSTAKYVLFGVPEDLGVKGNLGIGGADTLWIPFLQSFLNVQSNDFFEGNQILLAGHFDFGDIRQLTARKKKLKHSDMLLLLLMMKWSILPK